MEQKIVKTKQLRLNELFHYVYDNLDELFKTCDLKTFTSTDGKKITFNKNGDVESHDWMDTEDYFKVEHIR